MLLYKTDTNIYFLSDSVGVVWVWDRGGLHEGDLSIQNIPTSVQTEPRVNIWKS